LDTYIHITSPIRRLVDLLNILEVERCVGMRNKRSHPFYLEWTTHEKIRYINDTMKSIRRVQHNCQLLHQCMTDEETMLQYYDGIVFDSIVRSDGMNQYMVYLGKLQMLAKYITMDRLDNYSTHQFKLYIFKNEAKFKRKVMLSRK
jgi:exoribonuclease R